MKQNKLTTADKALLSKRGLVEKVNNQLKILHRIEHSRHRSVFNFMVSMMAAVVAYCLSQNKPIISTNDSNLGCLHRTQVNYSLIKDD